MGSSTCTWVTGSTRQRRWNQDSYNGKILRMNLNGTPVTTNPFYNAGDGISAEDFVYSYGHRNPFGRRGRAADDKHYVVENGLSRDRLLWLDAGIELRLGRNERQHDDQPRYPTGRPPRRR